MFSGVSLLLLLVNAVAWACLVQWPWGQLMLPSLIALAVVHLVSPLWTAFAQRDQLLHRAFVRGPFLVFACDALFLGAAWRYESWGELTVVFVPVLGALAIVGLAYAAAMMSLLAKIRSKKRAAKPKRD